MPLQFARGRETATPTKANTHIIENAELRSCRRCRRVLLVTVSSRLPRRWNLQGASSPTRRERPQGASCRSLPGRHSLPRLGRGLLKLQHYSRPRPLRRLRRQCHLQSRRSRRCKSRLRRRLMRPRPQPPRRPSRCRSRRCARGRMPRWRSASRRCGLRCASSSPTSSSGRRSGGCFASIFTSRATMPPAPARLVKAALNDSRWCGD